MSRLIRIGRSWSEPFSRQAAQAQNAQVTGTVKTRAAASFPARR
jgi:hypothetical protein